LIRLIQKAGILITLVCVIASTAFAQDSPKAEIFGGYSYADAEVSNISKGWNGAVAGNFTNWFGVVGDVSGHYNSQNTVGIEGETVANVETKIHVYTFTLGPQFTVHIGRVAPFVHLLAGIARTSLSVSEHGGNVNFSVSDSSNGFAGITGGGLDIEVTRPLAIRAIQVDYNYIRFNTFGVKGLHSNAVRIGAGLVIRF
jgi:Outer membrane protein beta-barrel domain